MAIARLALCLLNAGYMDVCGIPRDGDRTTRLSSIRIGSKRLSPITHRGHDHVRLLLLHFLQQVSFRSDRLSGVWGLNTQQTDQKSETADGSRFFFISCIFSTAFLKRVNYERDQPKK